MATLSPQAQRDMSRLGGEGGGGEGGGHHSRPHPGHFSGGISVFDLRDWAFVLFFVFVFFFCFFFSVFNFFVLSGFRLW